MLFVLDDEIVVCLFIATRTAWSASELEPDDVQSLAVASCTFSLWSEQIDAVAAASGDEADTVQAVFSTLARPG